MEMDISETGNIGTKGETRGTGMEGCWRCNGNRNGLWDGKGVVEDDGVGWTCRRSISDQYLTVLPH